VISNGDGIYNQDSTGVPTMTINSSHTEEAKQNDDTPCYVNPKQYGRIFQRRGARAKLEMEGRISKQRRVCFFQYFHSYA
jgi:hypothetical protein